VKCIALGDVEGDCGSDLMSAESPEMPCRLFIEVDDGKGADVAPFVELRLDKWLLNRIMRLASLVNAYELKSASALIPAEWCLRPDWQLDDIYGGKSTLTVFDCGFEVSALVCNPSVPRGEPSWCRTVSAFELWGSASEFHDEWIDDVEDDQPSDCLSRTGGWNWDAGATGALPPTEDQLAALARALHPASASLETMITSCRDGVVLATEVALHLRETGQRRLRV